MQKLTFPSVLLFSFFCVSESVHLLFNQCVRKQIPRQVKWQTALTTVVLDGNVFNGQLVLTSHPNEQWASSPDGTHGMGRRLGDDHLETHNNDSNRHVLTIVSVDATSSSSLLSSVSALWGLTCLKITAILEHSSYFAINFLYISRTTASRSAMDSIRRFLIGCRAGLQKQRSAQALSSANTCKPTKPPQVK